MTANSYLRHILQSYTRMEVRIDAPRDLMTDAGRGLQVPKSCHLDAARRTEMVQQSALACGTDARNLIQFALPDVLRTTRAVGGDREPVRLVAQALQEIQHRVTRR